MLVAGCFSLSTPSGSSGMWTGERRLLSWEFASRRALEILAIDVFFSARVRGGNSEGFAMGFEDCDEGAGDLEGVLARGTGTRGGERYTLLRGPGGLPAVFRSF